MISSWRWRPATVHDLDWFPQATDQLLLARYAQKRAVLRHPTATLAFGDVVVAVVGAVPDEDGKAVELWALFSPYLACAGFAAARACRRQFARIAAAARGFPLRLTIAPGDDVAARFAHWLGFRFTGGNTYIAQFRASLEIWQWTS